MQRSTSFLLGLALLTSLGCGSDDDIASRKSARATDIQIDDSSLRRGEETVVRTDFSFDFDSVNDGTNVVLVIKISNGLQYSDGSAEIQGKGDNDNKIGPQITRCRDGSFFLKFDMDEFDLNGAGNPNGDADAQLALIVRAVGSNGSAAVGARADYEESVFDCDNGFFADEVAGLTIDSF